MLCLRHFKFRWVNECADIFRNDKEAWSHLVPKSTTEPALLAERFFNCACSLMSIMLRQVVEKSLDEFVQFFSLYEVRMCTTVVRTCVHSLYKHIQHTSVQPIPCGLVARIRRSHRRGPGSIPGTGVILPFFPSPILFRQGTLLKASSKT